MKQYHDLVRHILETGRPCQDRTGTGTIGVFGYQMRFDLADGFPLVTTKRVNFKSVVRELLWFLSGSTSNAALNDMGCHIWDPWATEDGHLGPIYGAQWRSWRCPDGGTVDQIAGVLESLKNNPFSRRHVVSAWNPADLPDESVSPQENALNGRMCLAPCHCLFQFYVEERHGQRYLSCQLYQRSADVMIGVPYNIASYSLLTRMLAHVLGYKSGEFIHTFGDAHIYVNHVNLMIEQIEREPRRPPILLINPKVTDLFAFTEDDLRLAEYDPHPAIKAPVAV